MSCVLPEWQQSAGIYFMDPEAAVQVRSGIQQLHPLSTRER